MKSYLKQWIWLFLPCIAVLLPLVHPGLGKDSSNRSRSESSLHFPKYPGMSLAERLEKNGFAGNIEADRPLDESDRTFILSLADYLVDKRNEWGDRRYAAELLGLFGHRYGIPALMAVVRDEHDVRMVRQEATESLSKILDKRVVRCLIGDGLGSDSPAVQLQAWEDLPQMVGGPEELYSTSYRTSYKPPPKNEDELKKYLDVWIKWWEKHRDKAKLSRGPRGGF